MNRFAQTFVYQRFGVLYGLLYGLGERIVNRFENDAEMHCFDGFWGFRTLQALAIQKHAKQLGLALEFFGFPDSPSVGHPEAGQTIGFSRS